MKKTLFILLFCFCSPLLHAASEEDLPTGDGNPSQWTASTGTSKFAVVDETVAGAVDTDYIETFTLNNVQLFTFSHSVPVGASGISVLVNYRCLRGNGGGTAYSAASRIEVSNTGTTGTSNVLGNSFTNYTQTYATCPVSTCTNGTNGTWTKTDLDNLEIGVIASASAAAKPIRCSQVSASISYTSRRRSFLVE